MKNNHNSIIRLSTKMLILQAVLLHLFTCLNAQVADIQYEKSFGGSEDDKAYSIQQTNDGSYIVAGYSNSPDGDVHGIHGDNDFWVIKLNPELDTLWTKCYGGSSSDKAASVTLTNSGTYIVAGSTESTDGDVHGKHGNSDSYDYWVVKLNSDGDTLWTKCYGGSSSDRATSIIQTNDDAYLLAGYTVSTDGDVHGNNGSVDVWLVKLNSEGDTLWTKCYGGSSNDQPNTIIQTHDDGYLVAGSTISTDGDVHGNHGGADAWLIKLNSDGDSLWTKCYGGSSDEIASSIIQINDDGYIMAGFAVSTDGDVHGNHGERDAWLVKLNSDGDTLWTKCFGGSYLDKAGSIIQTNDDGYLVSVETDSDDGDIHGYHGGNDIWLIKINSDGDSLWTKCYGGSLSEEARSIIQTMDGQSVLAAYTSSNDGDISENHGFFDFWVVKLCYSSEFVFDTTICNGSSYFAGGAEQTEAGTYYDYYENICGSDSTVITVLTIENCGLAINTLHNNSLIVYPNPTDGVLYIDKKQMNKLLLLDITGRVVLESNEKQIDLSSYPAGLYYLKLIDNEGQPTTVKVIYVK